MVTVSVREEVQKALAAEWTEFAQRHPRLAAVIDQQVLMEQAAASLGDDPAFRAAMEEAAAAGKAAEIVVEAVRRYVVGFLKRLV